MIMNRIEWFLLAAILTICVAVSWVIAEPEGLSVSGDGEEVRAVVAMDILRAMNNEKVQDSHFLLKVPVAMLETGKEATSYTYHNPGKVTLAALTGYLVGSSDGQDLVQDVIDVIRDKDDSKPAAPAKPSKDYYFEAEAGPNGAKGRGDERTDRINTTFITRPDGSTESRTEVIVYPQEAP